MGEFADMAMEASLDAWLDGSYDDDPMDGAYIKKTYKKDTKSREVMHSFINELRLLNIKSTVIKIAASGSCYLEFEDQRIGKCRVGNHAEKSRLAYRWQIRGDINSSYENSSKGHRQFFFSYSNIEEAAKRIERYYNTIKQSDLENKIFRKSK